MSKHLSTRQINGLQKLGDVLLPGFEDFKSFSASGCAKQVDRILDFMPDSDLKDLKMLLLLLSFLPVFVIGWIVAALEKSVNMPGWIAGPFRFIRIGIRGLVMTLYYSHPHAHQVLDYRVGVYTADLRPQSGGDARYSSAEGLSKPPIGFSASDHRTL